MSPRLFVQNCRRAALTAFAEGRHPDFPECDAEGMVAALGMVCESKAIEVHNLNEYADWLCKGRGFTRAQFEAFIAAGHVGHPRDYPV